MKLRNYGLISLLVLGGCLPPQWARKIEPRYFNGHVLPIKNWDLGCDNLGQCVAIGAVPPNASPKTGIRAALRIELTHIDGLAAGMAIIPINTQGNLPEIRPDLMQANEIIEKLRAGNEPIIWFRDGNGMNYSFLGENFVHVESLYHEWQGKFRAQTLEINQGLPARAIELWDFNSPQLPRKRDDFCGEWQNAKIEAAWEFGNNSRLYKYSCEIVGDFNKLSLWFTLAQRGRLMPIGVEGAIGEKLGDKAAGLFNAHFDETSGLLISRTYANAVPDCGLMAIYAATDAGFVLAQQREARNCFGLSSNNWIQTYRNRAIALPD